jgi:hypothetical protein
MRFGSCGECNVVFRAEMRPQARKEGPVLLSGLADGGELDDSLAGGRKHTVTARYNRDFGLVDACCQFEEQCVELLASARRGSEMARGLRTAPFEMPQHQQPAQPAGRCPLCGDAGHSYRQGAYDHPAGREITQQCPLVLLDSKPCGLRHAFAGPMGTLCRDGLEGSVYRRRRRQVLFVAAEASVAASFSASGQSRVPQGLPQRQQLGGAAGQAVPAVWRRGTLVPARGV